MRVLAYLRECYAHTEELDGDYDDDMLVAPFLSTRNVFESVI